MNEPPISNPFDNEEEKDSQPSFYSEGMSPMDSDTSGRGLVWLMLGVAAMGCGLLIAAGLIFFKPDAQALYDQYFPSPTATSTRTFTATPSTTPTSTQTATRTPNWTATAKAQQATDTAAVFQSTVTAVISEWKVVLADNFDSNKNRWGTESNDDDRAKTIIKVADGKYSWDIATHDLEITWEKANTRSLGDFVISVDAKQIGGPTTADFGLTFREEAYLQSYYFGITNKGEYFLYLYNGNWITLIDYTKSKLILPNEYNRLTILAEGSHFTFYINGQYLAEYTDERFQTGTVGLFSLLDQANQHAVFEFDNFELRAP